MKFEYAPGATPIDRDEAAGLIPDGLAFQHELDALEQANILAARLWVSGRRHKNLLSAQFAQALHKKMFDRVWRWAGQYRRSNKNIECDWSQVPSRLMQLCDDATYWVQNRVYPWDELAARLHHQLVSIHPFPNGNGRHARFLTDLLLSQNGQQEFSLGARALDKAGEARTAYIQALRAADNGSYAALQTFARTQYPTPFYLLPLSARCFTIRLRNCTWPAYKHADLEDSITRKLRRSKCAQP